ncbi:MAG: ROK family protein, partial [Halodesulfurarchaeum sp.]
MAYVAGVDVGATHIRVAIADERGRFVDQTRFPTPRTGSGIDITERMLRGLEELTETVSIDPSDLAGVGIGSIGPLDLAEGVIEQPANLPDGTGRIPLVGPVQNLIGSDSVFLRNDAATGVIGERFFGERTPDNLVYLTISSGIGAGIIVDGSVEEGWDGNAGEVGHTIVDPEGRRTCGCGHDGHWEAYASGDNIPGYTRDLYERLDVDTDLPLHDPDFSAADVYGSAGRDPLADDVIERVTWWNVIGVTNVIQSYAPFVVVIGGAVALENEELVIDPLVERVPDEVMINVPDIRPTSFGDETVLRGSVALALRNLPVGDGAG